MRISCRSLCSTFLPACLRFGKDINVHHFQSILTYMILILNNMVTDLILRKIFYVWDLRVSFKMRRTKDTGGGTEFWSQEAVQLTRVILDTWVSVQQAIQLNLSYTLCDRKQEEDYYRSIWMEFQSWRRTEIGKTVRRTFTNGRLAPPGAI